MISVAVIDHAGPVPVYKQLSAILRDAITSGRYQPGRVIPSPRTLSQEHGIAIGTAKKAIAVLRAEQLVTTTPGRGTYVTGGGNG